MRARADLRFSLHVPGGYSPVRCMPFCRSHATACKRGVVPLTLLMSLYLACGHRPGPARCRCVVGCTKKFHGRPTVNVIPWQPVTPVHGQLRRRTATGRACAASGRPPRAYGRRPWSASSAWTACCPTPAALGAPASGGPPPGGRPWQSCGCASSWLPLECHETARGFGSKREAQQAEMLLHMLVCSKQLGDMAAVTSRGRCKTVPAVRRNRQHSHIQAAELLRATCWERSQLAAHWEELRLRLMLIHLTFFKRTGNICSYNQVHAHAKPGNPLMTHRRLMTKLPRQTHTATAAGFAGSTWADVLALHAPHAAQRTNVPRGRL